MVWCRCGQSGREFFHFDGDAGTLMGVDTGLIIGVGMRVTVKLVQAAPVTGGLELELLSLEDAEMPKGRGGRPGKGGGRRRSPAGRTVTRRKVEKSKHKAAKTKRKVTRKRK